MLACKDGLVCTHGPLALKGLHCLWQMKMLSGEKQLSEVQCVSDSLALHKVPFCVLLITSGPFSPTLACPPVLCHRGGPEPVIGYRIAWNWSLHGLGDQM